MDRELALPGVGHPAPWGPLPTRHRVGQADPASGPDGHRGERDEHLWSSAWIAGGTRRLLGHGYIPGLACEAAKLLVGYREAIDPEPGDRDAELVAVARRIVADSRHAGARLSQIALAEKLRSEGYKVANNRLRWLAAVSGLEAGQDGEAEARASGGR
jgi:hypothetical protein